AASGGLRDDLGDHPRLARAGKSLDQTDVGTVQGPADGLALGGIKVLVNHLDRTGRGGCQVSLAGEQLRQQGTTLVQDGWVGRRQLMGVEQSLLVGGEGEEFFL